MPFNSEKTVKLNDFLARVHNRLEVESHSQVVIFFEIFVQTSLVYDLVVRGCAEPDLAELDLLPGDFDVIYHFVAMKLHDAAGRNLSEAHPDAYQDAHAVSEAFCAELNEFFECSGEDGVYNLIPIKSFLELMVNAGLARVVP